MKNFNAEIDMSVAKNIKHDFDIIIIGAGCVGLSLALALHNHLKIAIIDVKAKPEFSHNDYDSRVFAINRASEDFFKRIGVWENIIASRQSPYEKMHVWDNHGKSEIEFDCRDMGDAHLGHIIELQYIEKALIEKANTSKSISLFFNTPLLHLQRYHDHILLLSPGKQFYTPCLIGADGAHSWTRQHAGIELQERPYEHTAVVATVETQQTHNRTARQVFLHTGPLAFLPLDQPHLSSIVWSTSHAQANELMSMSIQDFCESLTNAFCEKLGKVVNAINRHAFPLVARHAKQYTQHNIALIGDAAHTIHPLAGQGMNLGLADANVLSNLVNQSEHYFPAILREYERLRRGSNALMLDSMTGFVHLFGNEHPITSTLRNMGMSLCNQSNIIKQLLMDQASGIP